MVRLQRHSEHGAHYSQIRQTVPSLLILLCVQCQKTESQRKDRILQIVKDNASLGLGFEQVNYSTDLYRAGMTSYASVVLMIALENEFELEFPDAMLSRSVFASIDSIASAIESLEQVRQ